MGRHPAPAPQTPGGGAPQGLRAVHRQDRLAAPRVVAALMLREMSASYGRRAGGYLWSVAEPLAGIALMSWIFSAGLRHPGLGTNFPLFYATGLLPFYVFVNVAGRVMHALQFSRSLLAYPRVTIIDALLARFLLALLTQLLVAYLALTGILWIWDTGASIDLPRAALGFAMAAALGAGIGVLNCFLVGRFPIWQAVWGVVSRPLVLVSGVLFLVESMPESFRDWLLWNPVAHAVAQTRSGFYHGYTPDYVAPAYALGVGLGALAVGLLFLWRYHRDILEQ